MPGTDLTSKLPNRRDVDGLRAVAVRCVILYHLEVPLFSGGFIGVDIFFVISGYLISRNILTDAERGRFSLTRFYERRIRRLFPAAFVTILGTLVIGALWFSPEHFKGLTQDVVATLGSVSNFYFWRGSHDYFAKAVDPSAVLHFWSLAVEEQFYLAWPAVLLIGGRFLGKALPVFILLIGAASLFAAQSRLTADSAGAFYLPVFRAYEFAIGALVVFVERHFAVSAPTANHAGSAGVWPALLRRDRFRRHNGISRIECADPVHRRGMPDLGWSIPAFRFCADKSGRRPDRADLLLALSRALAADRLCGLRFRPGIAVGGAKLLVFFVAIAVSELMYRHVETPFRSRNTSLLPVAGYAAALIATVAAVAFIVNRQDGWPWRLSPEARQMADLQRFGFWPCTRSAQSVCAFGAVNERLGVQLIGDSFAEQYVATFDPVAKSLGIRGEAYTAEGCPMLVGLVRTQFDGTAKCRSRRDQYLAMIGSNNSAVVLSQSWLTYGESVRSEVRSPSAAASWIDIWRGGIEDTIRDLGANGRQFLIIAPGVEPNCRSQMTRFAPGPLWHAPSRPCPPVSLESVRARNAHFNAMLTDLEQRYPNQVRILFPDRYLCDADCPTTAEGVWLYWDVDHLTVAGARRVGSMADGMIRKFIERRRRDCAAAVNARHRLVEATGVRDRDKIVSAREAAVVIAPHRLA